MINNMLINCFLFINLNLGVILLVLSFVTLDKEAYEAPEGPLFSLGISENVRLSLRQISFLSCLLGLLLLYYCLFSLFQLHALAFFL